MNIIIRDIYALCVAFPKSFAETLYEHTRSLLEESVADLSNVSKGHSHSPCPQKNAHNFSLKSPTIFLPAPLSFPFFFCVCQISIHCFIIELQYNHALTL